MQKTLFEIMVNTFVLICKATGVLEFWLGNIHKQQTDGWEPSSSCFLPGEDDLLRNSRAHIIFLVTIFRFLKEADYNVERAYEWLLDTVQWRRDQSIADMSYISSAGNFYSETSGGFAFFHKQDRLGRPIVMVRMRYFPQMPKSSTTGLTDLIRPYACLIMEMARRLMLDITRQREQEGISCALVSQMVVIIDMAKSPFIPIVSACCYVSQYNDAYGWLNYRMPN